MKDVRLSSVANISPSLLTSAPTLNLTRAVLKHLIIPCAYGGSEELEIIGIKRHFELKGLGYRSQTLETDSSRHKPPEASFSIKQHSGDCFVR